MSYSTVEEAMQLNIKNHEVHAMATRLAAATGKSVTQAVGDAVRDQLAKVEREADLERRMAAVREITASIRADLPANTMTDAEFDAWMYDENGLPH